MLQNYNEDMYFEACAEGDGAALSLVGSNKHMFVRRSLFRHNAAGGGGAGMYLGARNMNVFVDECTFSNNTSLDSNGGAMLLFNKNTYVFISASSFVDNSGYLDVGVIHLQSYNTGVSMSRCTLMRNVAVTGNEGELII
jgi:hypothetical protein